ncbi:MAG: aspartate-semialdehyde dehydrogenase [Chloroflexota bacterium]|nr:aspartate-semialdehyde dehydrogenase [Chloroflexota bacterium]
MSSESENRPLTVAVVGSTGLVGQTMIQLLHERRFPVGELRPLASRSDGREVQFGDRRVAVQEATPDAFDGVDIALFSAGAEVSRKLAPEAVSRGALVIDNSSQWRMDAAVPLVVPEVNPHAAAEHRGIIANPNCSTMQLVPLLRALHQTAGLERVIVDTYQAVSGTGAEAVAELADQIRAQADGRQPESHVYPHPIGFNALPEIDVFLEDGYSKEEWKVIHESRKILEMPDLRVSCTAVRVPVFFAHSEAVHVETGRPISADEARSVFATLAGVVVVDEPTAHRYPLATHAAGRDEIFVGRVRSDASLPDGRGLAFWVVADNLRKGAATNAIQIAELVQASGWLRPRSQRVGQPA